MNLAERLMHVLSDSEAELDGPVPGLSPISDEQLGELFVQAHGLGTPVSPAQARVRFAIDQVVRDEEARQPRYTPDACLRLFEVLAERTRDSGWADLAPGLAALEHCTGPRPDVSAPATALVELLVAQDSVRQPYALLAVARCAGEKSLGMVVERLCQDVGPIVADEFAVVAGLTPDEQALLSRIDRDHRFLPSPSGDAWHRSADSPAYVAFARRALEAAADHTDAIRAGEIPYRADKAFTDREVTSLGQAARVALLRDEPWLPALFDRLLPGIALAPTAAKTLPSQALLYELGRAAQDFPTPELVTTLRTVRRTVRHAGVPKQLDKMLKKIEAALAERTDVALRLPRLGFDTTTTTGSAGDESGAGGVLRRTAGDYTAVVTVTETATLVWEKDGRPLRSTPAPVRRDHAALVKELRELVKRVDAQLVTLARALEGGFTVDAAHPYGWWRTELLEHPLAGTTVRRLIWEIEVAPGEWRAVLPEAGRLPDAPDDALVRLWHPIRSTPDAVRAWRDLLLERRIRQPFKQAFREIYLLTPAEVETRVYSNRFAAHLVHYRRLFALFRARGWAATGSGRGTRGTRTRPSASWRRGSGGSASSTGGRTGRATTNSPRPTRSASRAEWKAPGVRRRSPTCPRWSSARRCATWTSSSA